MSQKNWSSEARHVVGLLEEPCTPAQLMRKVQELLECTEYHARNVMAAAEGLYARYVNGMWYRR